MTTASKASDQVPGEVEVDKVVVGNKRGTSLQIKKKEYGHGAS